MSRIAQRTLMLALGLGLVTAAAGSLIFTNTFLSSSGIVLSGTGGSNGVTYRLLASPAPTPSTNWPAVATNTFDADGNFILTNPISGAGQFFRLEIPVVVAPTPPDFSMVGFATLNGFSSNNTLLVGGTTGGAAGPIVVASNVNWLVNYAQRSNQALRVLITADMDLSSLSNNNDNTLVGYPTGRITVNNDKTLYSTNGVTISRGSLQINSKHNVIIRNLKFRDMFAIDPNTPDPGFDLHDWDYVRVDGGHHVWVDHCDFNQVYDGMIDIKSAADYVTVSWCVFSNQKKCHLIGSSQTAFGDRSHLNVTFHHNYYTNITDRTPRMRFGNAHIFNLYSEGLNGKAIQSSMEAATLIENVYFANNNGGTPLVLINGSDTTNGIAFVTNSIGITTNLNAPVFNFNNPFPQPQPPYPYTLDAVTDVPGIVTNWAGVGKLTSF